MTSTTNTTARKPLGAVFSAKRDGSHALTLRVSSFVVMPLLEHGENHSTGAVNV